RLEIVAHMAALKQNDFILLSSQAQSGDREAQFWLGLIYEQGDRQQAESWFLKSAEESYAPAQRALGLLYSNTDRAKAVMWTLRAAEQGNTEAQFEPRECV